MELTAAIRGLEALKRRCKVDLYTDSQYVRNGIREWLPQWKKRGWKTADKKPVKNQDLWERLDELVTGHEIEWHWVKGHSATTATSAPMSSPTAASTSYCSSLAGPCGPAARASRASKVSSWQVLMPPRRQSLSVPHRRDVEFDGD